MVNLSTCKPPLEGGSPFAVLGLPVIFDLAEGELEGAFKALQLQHHPDRFVGARERAKAAEKCFAQIVWAYQGLKNLKNRAMWIFRLSEKWPVETDPEVLEEMMDLQEALESGKQSRASLRDQEREARQGLGRAFKGQAWGEAARLYVRWTSLMRLQEGGGG